MATKTRGGLLPLVIIIAVVAVGYFGVGNVYDAVTGFFGGATGSGVEIIGDGDSRVMTATSAESEVKNCTAEQIITNRECGDLSVLLVNARKMPFVARNTELAWKSGLPAVLTMNRSKQGANRAVACPPSFPRPHGGSCDEYPMASTDQGGSGARAEEVPQRENLCQGGSYRTQYPKDGDNFVVVIIYPDQIAPGPFTGTDIAKEQGAC